MLTRLRIKGFKNLLDLEERLGPFTCIAGPNGVGKSNLFDAIMFLSALADEPFLEAAKRVRGGSEPANLFAPDQYEMYLEAEMVIPPEGYDEFGQRAEASSTYVTYSIRLGLNPGTKYDPASTIELREESLTYNRKQGAATQLGFLTSRSWRDSCLISRRQSPFISTDVENGIVKFHQDRPRTAHGRQGRAVQFGLRGLPRAVLTSAKNAQEGRTAVLVREEMRNWRLLQLEPSSMRFPSDFSAPRTLGSDGSNLPATLFRLKEDYRSNQSEHSHPALLEEISSRVAELVPDIESVWVDSDQSRRLHTLMVQEHGKKVLQASALSDGTLRFLALTVVANDPEDVGVICLEEPENGVHPQRMGSMISLLMDIAVDVTQPLSSDNPLRQVIVNTHSPTVVSLVPVDSLLFAEIAYTKTGAGPVAGCRLRAVEETWRTRGQRRSKRISLAKIIRYLTPGQDDMREAAKGSRRGEDTVQSVGEYVKDKQQDLDL